MKICVFGLGYIGLSISTALSDIGHNVYGIDKNDYRVENIKKGVTDFYEKDLIENVLKNIESNQLNLYQKHEIESDTDIYIIAAGAHSKENGDIDTTNITEIVSKIVSSIKKYSVIMIVSTVPVGFCKKLNDKYQNETKVEFNIVYNPVFLRQGTTYIDYKNQNKILLGTKSISAKNIIENMYAPFQAEIITMDENSAELAKLAHDSFIGTQISFINEIANIAYENNANISFIQEGILSDDKIMNGFLKSGIGFGGEEISKSINSLIYSSKQTKTETNVLNAVRITNENQKRKFIAQILSHYHHNIENKVFCVWGLTYKPNTNDTRFSQSNTIIDTLLRYGATVKVYDPMGESEDLKQYSTKESALQCSNALIILTDWDEFKNPDFDFISKNIVDKVIFDARNIYIKTDLRKYGLKYYCTGKDNE